MIGINDDIVVSRIKIVRKGRTFFSDETLSPEKWFEIWRQFTVKKRQPITIAKIVRVPLAAVNRCIDITIKDKQVIESLIKQ